LLARSATYETTIWASGSSTITAGAGPTRLMASGLGDTLVGGGADDTIQVNNLADVFSGGDGIDTLYGTVSVSLTNDIENLTMDGKWSPVVGIGNDGANILEAVTANVTLNGKGGDDVILAYGQRDTLLFEQGSGRDIVYNFHTGAADGDVAGLAGFGFISFVNVVSAMTQQGTDVLLQLSANDLILFKDTTIGAFTADNFQLSGAINFTDYNGAVLPQSAPYLSTLWASGGSTIAATAAPTRLMASGLGDTLVGGSADDTIQVNNVFDKFSGGAGVDTVYATVNVTLPADVENLTLDGKWSPIFGIGNANANFIKAVTANVTINGKGGDDVIVAYGQNDTLIFDKGSGHDVVYNFQTGAAHGDIARLEGYGFNTFTDVNKAMTQQGSDVLLKLSATDAVLFKNTTVAAFTQDNFQVSIDPWKLKPTFSEEFNALSLQNQSAGGGLWATSFAWDNYSTLAAHNIPHELEVYVDPQFAGTGTTPLGLNPFSTNNGILTISATPTPAALKPSLWNLDYTSGLLTTQGSFSQQYGYFEMRADLPDAKGAFPAFWLLPADGSFTSELDVMEYIGQPNTLYQTIHYGPDADHWHAVNLKTYVGDIASGFHTFGLLWTAQTLTWYVDRVQIAQLATPAEMNRPMYMLVNYAVGGDWAGAPTSTTLPGFAIDYIHAYSLDAAPLASPIQGTSGADTLAGTTAADVLNGGPGNDLYIVGVGDTVVEDVDAGIDTVNVAYSFVLPSNVENLTLTGTAAITGTGNELNNSLTGNSAANTLTGGDGADTLNGAAGIDRLVGGAGDDTYVLGGDADVVVESAGQGVDTVTSAASYILGANVENLVLTGAGSAGGFGNELANVITGNSGANRLEGRAGADTIDGSGGADTIVGQTGADRLTGGTGADLFVFAKGDGHDVVTDFGNGADVIDVSSFLNAGLKATLVVSGADTLIQFSASDDIRLVGVSTAHLSATTSGFIFV
jgi:beta-glucanase (GH16 family)